MSFAIVVSGQGMQHPDMLPWLAEDDTVRAMQRMLGIDDWRACAKDPAWAGRNANAQVLLTGLALAAWAQLAPHLPAPAAVAGYSVGELAAFAVAGVFDADTALGLARHRAALMDRAAAANATGLMGVSGVSESLLERVCEEFGLVVAIRNGIDSVVLGGLQAMLPRAVEAARRRGAHAVLLHVQVASHTPWMAEAARGFASRVAPMAFRAAGMPLFSDAQGRVAQPPQLKHALAMQIDHPVRWDECMEGIAGRRVACVLEIGPGQALARLWNSRYADTPARSVDEFRSAEAIVRHVRKVLQAGT
ncbi:ACP S-malonyltransferase [Variovorax paradoxus]|uniref:ACP S-malonyltransferase n=1 Tax=Variovorax paradoxus TaxID=34073 RepID=A0AA91DI01_VARPD|nr:acyltransferase domain-containing protein [Variovorax paradoxus]OAK58096.1 ACP S-malonyltransferase [Variovorax paradoxus]